MAFLLAISYYGFSYGFKKVIYEFAAHFSNQLKNSKSKANFIHVMDFASDKLFSATYLDLYLARKCKAQ